MLLRKLVLTRIITRTNEANLHIGIKNEVYPKLKLLGKISSFLSPEILLKIYKTTNLPKYSRLWLHRMGFLQQEELRFSGKVVKQSNANNLKNKSLSVHTVNERETWPVNII